MAPVSPKMSAQERAWRAQEDLRTLSAAEQIRRDAGRLGAARAEAKKQIASLSKVSKRK